MNPIAPNGSLIVTPIDPPANHHLTVSSPSPGSTPPEVRWGRVHDVGPVNDDQNCNIDTDDIVAYEVSHYNSVRRLIVNDSVFIVLNQHDIICILENDED